MCYKSKTCRIRCHETNKVSYFFRSGHGTSSGNECVGLRPPTSRHTTRRGCFFNGEIECSAINGRCTLQKNTWEIWKLKYLLRCELLCLLLNLMFSVLVSIDY